MPLLHQPLFESPWFIKGGHTQTIAPHLFRRHAALPWREEQLTLADGDFLELFWVKALQLNPEPKPLVIISHGMEGSVHSTYVLALARHLQHLGYDSLLWNFRGCGATLNRLPRFYHSGATEDLKAVIHHAKSQGHWPATLLVGFSLGGNLTLKCLAELSHPSIEEASLAHWVIGGAVQSVPCDLAASAQRIAQPDNRVYEQRFLRSLASKIKRKAAMYPDYEVLNPVDLARIKTVIDFDDRYTAILHGFAGATDYYARNNSLARLSELTKPTFMLNAKNDPFLSISSTPVIEALDHSHLHLLATEQGGHCGFWHRDVKNWGTHLLAAWLEELAMLSHAV